MKSNSVHINQQIFKRIKKQHDYEIDWKDRIRNIRPTRKYPFFSGILTFIKFNHVIGDKARIWLIPNMFSDLGEIKLHYEVLKVRTDTCNNIYQSLKLYAKWMKSHTHTQILWFHLYEIIEQAELVMEEKQSSPCLGARGCGLGLSEKRYEKTFWVMVMIFILKELWVTQVYAFIKIH